MADLQLNMQNANFLYNLRSILTNERFLNRADYSAIVVMKIKILSIKLYHSGCYKK